MQSVRPFQAGELAERGIAPCLFSPVGVWKCPLAGRDAHAGARRVEAGPAGPHVCQPSLLLSVALFLKRKWRRPFPPSKLHSRAVPAAETGCGREPSPPFARAAGEHACLCVPALRLSPASAESRRPRHLENSRAPWGLLWLGVSQSQGGSGAPRRVWLGGSSRQEQGPPSSGLQAACQAAQEGSLHGTRWPWPLSRPWLGVATASGAEADIGGSHPSALASPAVPDTLSVEEMLTDIPLSRGSRGESARRADPS